MQWASHLKINLSIFKFKFHVRALQKCTRVSGKTGARIELSSTLGKGEGNTPWHSDDDDDDGLDKGETYVRLKGAVSPRNIAQKRICFNGIVN